jgi:hypothetical protein
MSTSFIDFGELKQRTKIEDVATWLGLTLKLEGGKTLRGACPACGGERKLAITPSHVRDDGSVGSYFCHAEKKGGDLIALVKHVRGTNTMPEAAKLIADHFGGGTPAPSPAARRDKQPAAQRSQGYDPEAYVERLDPANELITSLGVSVATFKTFQAGYAASGVHRTKLALPLHNRDGKLIGHFGRSIKGESPLLTFVNGQNPAEHIFGAHLVAEGELNLARDPLDVLVAYENGEHNVVAFLTDGITAQQWEMLASLMDQRKVERSFLF